MIDTKIWRGMATAAPWNSTRWPNFTPAEIACPCCGEVCIDDAALDALQRLRNSLAGPLKVTSGHRCERHNRNVDGAPGSVHLDLAFDLALGPYAPGSLLNLARDAGFMRFGLMARGLHVDTHPLDAHHAGFWTYGPASMKVWAGLYPADAGNFEPHKG